MHLAAILPRFLQIGPYPRHDRSRPQTAAAALPERRTISRHAIVALENRRLQLRVLRGWIWVTRDGCPMDLVLGPGGVFEQQPGARVLLQAFEDVELLVAGAGAHPHNA